MGMLLFLREKASERKVLLFNYACCRRIWNHLDAEDQDAVERLEVCADDPAASREFQMQLEPLRAAALAMAGFGDRNCPVSESLAQLLTNRTTVRLHLDGSQGPGIGSLAFKAARLSTMAEPEIARSAAQALEERGQAELVREIFGNPFRSVVVDPTWRDWNGGTVLKLARAIYNDGRFDLMPILADALEDAGCNNPAVLTHCREPREHARGCWLIDLILSKHL